MEVPPALAYLLQPIPLQTFLSRYYEREPLFIERDSPAHYDALTSVDSLDDILSATALTCDDVLVVDDSRDIDPGDYTFDDESIDTVRVHRLFDEGATIILRQMHNKLPTLARLCRNAEQQFSCRFQANLYFSPPNAQGLTTHHDTHDVFVLQILGSKHWQTYEPTVPLPLPGQRYYWETAPDRPPVADFTLRPGDLFYCPRGFPHNARATQDASLHITLGSLAATWAELLLEVVADVALRDSAFRASLPPGYATQEIEPAVLDGKLNDLLARLQLQARPRHVLEMMAERFTIDRHAVISGQRRTLQAAAALTLDSRVGVQPGLLYRVSEHRRKVTLICNYRQIAFPRFTASSLKFALCTPSFLVRDLPGPLTDGAKIILIRRLMREALVVTVPD